MAKKAQKVAPRKAVAKPAVEAVIPVISEKAFITIVKKCDAIDKGLAETRGEKGGVISDAVERHHLHKGAFGIWGRLNRMSSRKRSELLHHLDLYRERSDWDDQLDLFRTKAAEETVDEPETDVDEDQEDLFEQPTGRTNGNGARQEPAPAI